MNHKDLKMTMRYSKLNDDIKIFDKVPKEVSNKLIKIIQSNDLLIP